ncbi:FtsX-like permease family protein [Nonomuraea muscovyensis]|uniref:Putative ABC transport system permease protein n=1 Tax=Nonomuraea muscovyensis TaxID=1124761 RepID=A0A7X0BZV2_9ACTN|nr:ABC transporter permease [Nonomuraea muscovyensis]MBB6345151.1 putative ABC transport system permease protein [Nonomuraea muscovyensis]
MTLVLAWNNVRFNRMGFAASFAAVIFAVTLVGGSGLVVVAASARDELNDVMGLLVLSAVVSGFVAVFVVAGTLSLHVLRQRRTWGLLRSVGMTPRQVSRLIMAEALVVAVLASVVGCLLAVPYAALMAASMRMTGLAPEGVPVEATTGPFVLASVVGVAATLLAARVATRKAVGVGPLEVLRESAAQRRLLPWSRAVVGVAALAGGGVLLFLVPQQVKASVAAPTALGATMALCVGASALGPVVLRGMGWLLGAVVAWLDPGAGMLARSSLVTQPRRAMAAASPVMLTVALACTFLFSVATTDVAAGVIRTGPSAWVAPLLVGSTVVYTVISVLNATAMTMGERAEEIRLLRTVGTTPRQLARAVCWETMIVTCVGTLLGTGIAAASLTALGEAVTGKPWFAYSLPQYVGLVLICAVSSLAGGLTATRRSRYGSLTPS